MSPTNQPKRSNRPKKAAELSPDGRPLLTTPSRMNRFVWDKSDGLVFHNADGTPFNPNAEKTNA
jgi:hypothetical protein